MDATNKVIPNTTKFILCALYDDSTKLFGKIMLFENQELCERHFHILIETQHLEKYTDKIFMILLGNYDITSGDIDLYDKKICVNYNGSTKEFN